MSSLARLSLDRRDDLPVARLDGEVDLSNASGLGQALRDAVPNAALGLVVDLSRVTYLDSAGIHLLFDLGSRLRRRRQELRLVVPETAPIRRILSLVGLGEVAPVHETLEEAVTEARSA